MENSKHADSTTPAKTRTISYWTAFGGWQTVSHEDPSGSSDGTCPYSKDIRWVQIEPGTVVFSGTGELNGNCYDDDDESRSSNCLGELTRSFIHWDSFLYTLRGDTYTPNDWLKEIHITAGITRVSNSAFTDCIAVRRLVVYSPDTVLETTILPSTVIVAPAGSKAEALALKRGNPFVPLDPPQK